MATVETFPCARAIGSLKQPTAPLHIGDHVACNEARGVFCPCNYCGHNVFVVKPGTGPHAAHIRCEQCARGGRFLSRQRMCPRFMEPTR